MHAILFDCRDAGQGCTLRVFDDSRMVLQAWLFEVDPVAQGRRLCEWLEIEMELRGPAAKPKTAPVLTLDPPAVYDVPEKRPSGEVIPRRDCNQLALF
jgi:hypothetical protein